MNPAKTFPIEESYINLAIVETQEQQEKEKKLRDNPNSDAIMGTFEDIYSSKTPINIENIFTKCKDQTKKVLVFGRAGIGKSTFCQYAAQQWGTGAIWPEYELVVLIPLRSLTENRYSLGTSYTPIDIVIKQYFSDLPLSEKNEKFLREQLGKSRVLWLLDGYDEIAGNVPAHLEDLMKNLLNTTHHILTSRPHGIDLLYHVKMEIIGFTNDNIVKYVNQFFDQIKDELHDAFFKGQKLHSFLKITPNIWGVAHIPVNLELICSLWGDNDCSETKTQTMTELYDNIIEWLCRRYLKRQETIPHTDIDNMYKDDIYELCAKELAFLETLAFNGMEDNKIILKSKLLEKALKETKCSFKDRLLILNIGILKSINDKPTGKTTQTNTDHYFVHLSFQEHFAARYLVNALNGSASSQQRAIEFIKKQKYNQRFILVFTFLSGLLIERQHQPSINRFWDTISGAPMDLIGFRHMQLLISCLDEGDDSENIPHRDELINFVTNWIKYIISKPYHTLREHLKNIMKRCFSLPNNPTIQNLFINLVQTTDSETKYCTISIIGVLQITKPQPSFIHSMIILLQAPDENLKHIAYQVLQQLGETAASEVINRLVIAFGDKDSNVRSSVCYALGMMGEKIGTIEVINPLVIALKDENSNVKSSACNALGKIGENAATREVINRLMMALEDENSNVRSSVCHALGNMGEKAASSEVINRLVIALEDENWNVRSSACHALSKMGEKAASSEVINRLIIAIGDKHWCVKSRACDFLKKVVEETPTCELIDRLVIALGDNDLNLRWSACDLLVRMIEKGAANDVINRLVIALGDENSNARSSACHALGKMGEKAATSEVINRLVMALEDENSNVRSSACHALGNMGGKLATSDVIDRVVIALGDKEPNVRSSVCDALGEIGEKVASSEMINRVAIGLGDENSNVRRSACDALGKIGEKAATSEVVNRLLVALDDDSSNVRSSACHALMKMGKIAATSEVINRMMIALGDENSNVKSHACDILVRMSEKGEISEMINRLVIALDNDVLSVRENACNVLGEIGEKAATSDVINRLMMALDDKDSNVRTNAYNALGKMGEKAATSEVINRLIIALEDKNSDVKSNACNALGNMGEKVAASEVINRLIIALEDKDSDVKRNACNALGKMGEKAATSDAINRLMITLEDKDSDVKNSACHALGKMGEKAASSEVINRLIVALEDECRSVRRSACEVLLNMSETAASGVVITRLLIASAEDSWIHMKVGERIAKLRDAFWTLKGLHDNNSLNVYEKSKNSTCVDEKFVASVELLNMFLDTEDSVWLPAIIFCCLSEGNAVTLSDHTVVIYRNSEVLENIVSSVKVLEELRKGFNEQAINDSRPLCAMFKVA
jgi:HEAT repeat protein